MLYLVRHSHADFIPDEQRPLSPKGVELAIQVKALLMNLPIKQIISSTSRRAIETVEGLGLETGIAMEFDDRLCERRLSNAVLSNFMDAVRKTWQDFDFAHPGGETNRQGQNRVISLLKELQFETDDEHVVLSTHGNLLALILNHFDSSYGFNFWHSLTMPDIYKIDPAGVIERLWKGNV